MARSPKRSLAEKKIAEFAKRRSGASYLDAAHAAQERLWTLAQEYETAPPAYRGYILVGICTCLESHIKYHYASAAEGFDDKPELLHKLFKDIQVDIDTLISATSQSFALADIVAANISVSSLSAYFERASHFFAVFYDDARDFPWSFLEGSTDAAIRKKCAKRIGRLEKVFEARHKLVHETSVNGPTEITDLGDDPLECVRDAIWVTELFEFQHTAILQLPQYASIRDDEGLEDAVCRVIGNIDTAFTAIQAASDKRQHEKLDEFKQAFLNFLWAQCDFQSTTFIAERSEFSRSYFLDLAPEYLPTLAQIGQKNKYMLAQYPLDEQYADLERDIEFSKESDG